VTLPTFLIIGAMKAGTTSLHHYIRSHPQVFMSERKELNYFTTEENLRLGQRWYEEFFADAEGAFAVGEASPTYSMFPTYPGVPARIAQVLPKARLVYLIRNPIERMRSQYLHYRFQGWKETPFAKLEEQPIANALLTDPQYVSCSSYALQIEQYLEHFPRNQLLVVVAEDLRHQRELTMKRIFEFLGVDPTWIPMDLDREIRRTSFRRTPRPLARTLRRSSIYRMARDFVPSSARVAVKQRLATRRIDESQGRMSADLRQRLELVLQDDVIRLRAYVGAEFDGWGIV
jgi:Sulfotransferase domain